MPVLLLSRPRRSLSSGVSGQRRCEDSGRSTCQAEAGHCATSRGSPSPHDFARRADLRQDELIPVHTLLVHLASAPRGPAPASIPPRPGPRLWGGSGTRRGPNRPPGWGSVFRDRRSTGANQVGGNPGVLAARLRRGDPATWQGNRGNNRATLQIPMREGLFRGSVLADASLETY